MKYFLFLILGCIYSPLQAQPLFPTHTEQAGEMQLNEAVVVSTRLFTNDTARYHYNQMKHYVKMILPYVDTAVALFQDIEAQSVDMSARQRRQYIRSRESEIKHRFEDKLSQLNITQGRLLVKLINRQLKKNCYSILQDLKNPITAAWYLSVARIHGINLSEDYVATENPDLEMIMRNLGYEEKEGQEK
jgi:hypothetical protein